MPAAGRTALAPFLPSLAGRGGGGRREGGRRARDPEPGPYVWPRHRDGHRLRRVAARGGRRRRDDHGRRYVVPPGACVSAALLSQHVACTHRWHFTARVPGALCAGGELGLCGFVYCLRGARGCARGCLRALACSLDTHRQAGSRTLAAPLHPPTHSTTIPATPPSRRILTLAAVCPRSARLVGPSGLDRQEPA